LFELVELTVFVHNYWYKETTSRVNWRAPLSSPQLLCDSFPHVFYSLYCSSFFFSWELGSQIYRVSPISFVHALTTPFSGLLRSSLVPPPKRVFAMRLVFGSPLFPMLDLHSWFLVFTYGDLYIWLHIILRCSLSTVLVPPTGGFDLTTFSSFLDAMGVWEGLKDISKFVPLLMPLVNAIFGMSSQTAITGGHFS
jgi:hypothetical protein